MVQKELGATLAVIQENAQINQKINENVDPKNQPSNCALKRIDIALLTCTDRVKLRKTTILVLLILEEIGMTLSQAIQWGVTPILLHSNFNLYHFTDSSFIYDEITASYFRQRKEKFHVLHSFATDLDSSSLNQLGCAKWF